jgi:hypothetical protein
MNDGDVVAALGEKRPLTQAAISRQAVVSIRNLQSVMAL